MTRPYVYIHTYVDITVCPNWWYRTSGSIVPSVRESRLWPSVILTSVCVYLTRRSVLLTPVCVYLTRPSVWLPSVCVSHDAKPSSLNTIFFVVYIIPNIRGPSRCAGKYFKNQNLSINFCLCVPHTTIGLINSCLCVPHTTVRMITVRMCVTWRETKFFKYYFFCSIYHPQYKRTQSVRWQIF